MNKFTGEIKKGKFISEDGKYIIDIKPLTEDIRNLQQNKLYYKRCTELSNHTGHSVKEIHDFTMVEAGYIDKMIVGKMSHFVRQSSTVLTVKEFVELIHAQDRIARSINDDLPPESWLRLTEPGEIL